MAAILGMLGGAVVNHVMGEIQDNRQIRQQEKLQGTQIRGAKEMSAFQAQQDLGMARAQWGANVEGMKEAGLSPGLIYGKGGAGGVSRGTAPMPTGATAGDPNAGVANALNLGMAKAQMQVLESQAEKNKAEAEKIKGVDTANTAANTGLTQLQSDLAEIQKGIQNRTIDKQVSIIWSQSLEAEGRAMEAYNRGEITRDSAKAQVDQIKNEALNEALKSIAIKKEINLTDEKIKEISNSIQQKWQELNINKTSKKWEHEDRIKAIEDYTEAMLWGAGIQGVTNVANTAAQILTRPAGMAGKTVETIGRDGKSHYEFTQYHNK